jgi:hypothetical protein
VCRFYVGEGLHPRAHQRKHIGSLHRQRRRQHRERTRCRAVRVGAAARPPHDVRPFAIGAVVVQTTKPHFTPASVPSARPHQSALWYIEARGQHSSDVRPSDLLGANRQPWSSGSVVLKCKYSSGGTGTYPHAFPSQRRYLLEPAPDAPPDRDAEESSSSTRRTQADLFAAIAERRKRKHA